MGELYDRVKAAVDAAAPTGTHSSTGSPNSGTTSKPQNSGSLYDRVKAAVDSAAPNASTARNNASISDAAKNAVAAAKQWGVQAHNNTVDLLYNDDAAQSWAGKATQQYEDAQANVEKLRAKFDEAANVDLEKKYSRSNDDRDIETRKKEYEEEKTNLENLKNALAQAEEESKLAKSKMDAAQKVVNNRNSVREVENAVEKGASYKSQYDAYSQSLEELNKQKAQLTEQLEKKYSRANNDADFETRKKAYDEEKERIEKLEREIERLEGTRKYAFSNITKDAGAKQVIRQGEALAKTMKEQFLAGNMPDPTSNANYRSWVDSNPNKTAKDYVAQLYADREPNEKWTQEEKDRYYILMTSSPERALQYAVAINSAINSEENAAAAERFGNLFSNYDMSKEAREDRSGAMNAIMGIGNVASDIAGIAGGVATGPVKLFNWLDNIYQNNEKGGYYAGNSTPRISDYTDRLLNQNAQRLNNYGTIRDDMPVLGGKGLGDLYQLVESVAQSMAYGSGLTKAFGVGATTASGIQAAQKAAKLSTGLIFFGQAADSSYNEYIQRGMSREQATVGSFFAGLAEAAGEEFSIDHLISGDISEGLARYVAKQSFIEASEEGFTNVLNLFGDELAASLSGSESKMQQDIRTLIRNGMSEDNAKREVWKNFVEDTVFDMFGGAISGGLSGFGSGVVMGGPQAAVNKLYQTIQQREQQKKLQAKAENMVEQAAKPETKREAPVNPLRDSLNPQTPQEAAGAQEAPGGQVTQPTAGTTPQGAGTAQDGQTSAQAAEEPTKSNVQRFQEIQKRLEEINNALNENPDEETASSLYEEGEALYQESRQLESLPEVIQQKRVDAGEVSKGFGTVENHIDNRTDKDLSKPSVKAFQFDHPELHQYFVDAAQELIEDVEYAEKLTKANMYELGSAIESGPVRQLMDMGLTKPEIIKALQDIIANNGQENYAKAKKVERVLSEMMTDGWRDLKNQNHDAVPDYIAAKDSINGAVKSDSWEKYLADHETVLALGEVTEEQLRAEWEQMHPQEEAATVAEPEPAPEASQPVETASAAPEPAPQPVTEGTQSEQSAGTIPASEQTTAERTNGTGNERERNMSRNLRGNEKAEPDLRNSFEQNRDLYTQLTNAEVAAKAAEIVGKGYDAAKNDIYEKIGQAKAGAKLAPEYAVAGYQLANEMVRRGETEAARELCADIAAELTFAGQVGQIGRLILAADPSIRIRTVERLVKKLNDGLSNRQKAKNIKNNVGTETGEIKVSDEALQQYAAAETDEAANEALDAIEQEIADQIPATFRDKFTALRYLNMLGNLKTQGRNIVGNAAMMTATNVKYLTQHVMELARAAATGGKYEVNTALNTSKELRQQAAADFEANADEIKGDAKYADVGRQAAKGIREKQQIFGTTGNALWDNTVGRGLEGARKATNWAMEVGDEIFLRQVYVRSFAGWMKAHGVTDVNSASAEQVSAAREFAKKEAQEATFHDSNQFSEFVTSIDANWDKGHSEKVNKIGAAGKMITQGIMPFRKTPANVAVRAIEYSPAGAVVTLYEAIQAKKGNASAADVINSAAKNLTGTALFGIGMLMAAAGRARASGDDEDEKLNNFKKLQGEMDYSVKVGDKYISLSQLAPMAIPFFMGVKLNELLEYNDNLLSLDSLSDILGVVSEPMLEMSMLSGVNDFLNDLSSVSGDTGGLVALVGNAALSYLSQGLTNSLLGQLEQASERNRQTTYSDTKSKDATGFDRFIGKNQYKIGKYSAKIPGIDYNQQDYVDAWGRTQSNGGAGERAFNAFLNPTYTGKDRSTDVDEELERLYRDNKGKDGFPNVFPQKRSRSDVIGDGVVMTPDEYLSYSKESGQKKLELVREFMQSGDYKNLTDEQRAETIHNLYAFADATALQKVRDANGVTVENKYAKISDLSDVPAYLAATERFKADAEKEGTTFNGWTNTNFEKYVSAGLKAEDLDVLAESALSDARKPAYDLMREVGMSPKEYMDAIAVMDGEKHDGQFKQADVYNWLVKNTTMSTEQKNQLWDMLGNNWKTSFSDYKPK